MADLLLGAVAVWAAGLVYLLPALVAARRSPHVLPRLLVRNVLLGWTVIVWLACLWVAIVSGRAPTCAVGRERTPDWLRSLPRDERAWQALPVVTAPLFDGKRR